MSGGVTTHKTSNELLFNKFGLDKYHKLFIMLFIAGDSGCRLIRDLLVFLISGLMLFGIVHVLTTGSMMLLSF